MLHTLITITIFVVSWFFDCHEGVTWFVAASYIGREHAQAEYRTIYSNYGNKRASAPWWCGFERRAWNFKSMLDWLGPLAVAIFASLI